MAVHAFATSVFFLVLATVSAPQPPHWAVVAPPPWEDPGWQNPGRTAVDRYIKSLPPLWQDPAMTGEDPNRYRHPRVVTNFMWLMVDSVVINGRCICSYSTDHPTPFDHDVGKLNLRGGFAGPGEWSIRELCEQRAAIQGEDFQVEAVFNDIQCGHGPSIETGIQDETDPCQRALFISDVHAPYISNWGTADDPCYIGPRFDFLNDLPPKTKTWSAN
ncbi:unnamed protein product [Vitrella brassicaformis CCMP3155]|uniref:Uncharacterized protein n=2 Tax=Vitrella brassicaformis TaxID=1169539 RepID=A0A0G4FSG8_VITBC|nr:unnamed protein product [Vitrella brassicaformis CCMP3155]|eukprot:CEM17640.1 unnamed protein product [Vitrella brassicaformis CCMP3155]